MLKKLFEDILNGWPKASSEQFLGHPLANKLRKELRDKVQEELSKKKINYTIKASAGAGNWANVPWLSMLSPEMTQSTQEGIYPVYLFRADGSGVYLSLELGITNLKNKYGAVKAKEKAKLITNQIHEKYPKINNWSNVSVDLKATTELGKSYEWGSAGAKFYSVNEIPLDEDLLQDLFDLIDIYKKISIEFVNPLNEQSKDLINTVRLPKPFILLAGISGTGKTRFVIEQAKASAEKFNLTDNYNCCLVPVRPDWHEPSDLLGYISRISGTNYISTDFLNFIVKAWCNAIESADSQSFRLNPMEKIAPFWLCLDEMNLAPVEQYFADYLSILETRKWEGDKYFCHAIMSKGVMGKLRHSNTSADINSMDSLWSEIFKDIDVNDSYKEAICEYFESNGIALPPNLIVAGTVNMDETTHGFSRKVIDRALTIDFGEFFPNDYDSFFKEDQKTRFKALTYSWLTQSTKDDLASTIDVDGDKSIVFLSAVNAVLKQTPFELAYRALNELLLQVACFNPQTEADLQAVWDDFLMSKVLPRIDGDEDKLRDVKDNANSNFNNNLLESLSVLLKSQLDEIWDGTRLDFYREKIDGSAINDITCRSKAKLLWMQNRLDINTFTSYWP